MLSNKAQYAFRALTYLVDKYNQGPVLISEIAKKKRIPLKFLENILLELKRANILDSKKGEGGVLYQRASIKNINCSSGSNCEWPYCRVAPCKFIFL